MKTKRLIAVLLMVAVLVVSSIVPAFAASSASIKAGTISGGEATFTFTVSAPEGVGAMEFSLSATGGSVKSATASAGTLAPNGGFYNWYIDNAVNSVTITVKCSASASEVKLTYSGLAVYDDNADPVPGASASGSATAKEAATTTTTKAPTTTTTKANVVTTTKKADTTTTTALDDETTTDEETTTAPTKGTNLDSLKIVAATEAVIDFNPAVYEYTVKVPAGTNALDVEALLGDVEGASVTVEGADDLAASNNKVTITVLDENGVETVYTIIVEEETPLAVNDTNVIPESKGGVPVWLLIILIILALIIGLVIGFIIGKKLGGDDDDYDKGGSGFVFGGSADDDVAEDDAPVSSPFSGGMNFSTPAVGVAPAYTPTPAYTPATAPVDTAPAYTPATAPVDTAPAYTPAPVAPAVPAAAPMVDDNPAQGLPYTPAAPLASDSFIQSAD